MLRPRLGDRSLRAGRGAQRRPPLRRRRQQVRQLHGSTRWSPPAGRLLPARRRARTPRRTARSACRGAGEEDDVSVRTSPQSTDVRISVVSEHERLATLPQLPLRPLGLGGVLRRGFTYWRPHWALAIPILLVMFVQGGFNTFFDLNLQQIIDHVLIDQDGPLLAQILAQILGFYLLATAAAVVGNYLSARVGARILNDLRRQMFTHLQRLSVGTSSGFGVKMVASLVIGLGSFVAVNGGLSIGTLVAFVALANDVCKDAYDISKKVAPRLIAAGGGIQRIEELLNEQPQVIDSPGAGTLPRLPQAT